MRAAEGAHSDFVTTLLLALTNPTTVLSFLAVLAVLGLGESRPKTLTLFLVAGIFVGSMLWWIVLALITGHFRERFDDRAVLWMNRIAAFAIGGFGVVTMLLAAVAVSGQPSARVVGVVRFAPAARFHDAN